MELGLQEKISGIDVTGIIKALGINLGTAGDGVAEVNSVAKIESEVPVIDHSGAPEVQVTEGSGDAVDATTRRAAGAATFVVAYAVHKVFAPARIGVTVTATPFIVRYLRRIGFLKPPKPKSL